MKRGLRRFSGSALAAFLLWIPASGPALAQQARLSDDQVKERLAFIERALDAGTPRAEAWWYGWLAAYSFGTVAFGASAMSHWTDTKLEGSATVPDHSTSETMLVACLRSAAGIGLMLGGHFAAATASGQLRKLPDITSEERQAKLDRAEKLLRESAEREIEGRSTGVHVYHLFVNVGAAVVTAGAFHRPWTSGLAAFVVCEALSLITIYSQPMRAARDLGNYEAKYLKKGAALPALAERKWSIAVGPGGLAVRYEF